MYKIYNEERFNRTMFFPVAKVPTTIDDKSRMPFKIINAENNRVISYVSQQYKLIPNTQVLKPFIEKFGIDKVAGYQIFGGGRSFMLCIKTGRVLEIGVGDRIEERIYAKSSYDKTRAFWILSGGFRGWCSNSLVTSKSHLQYRKIHVGEIPVDELVRQAIMNYEQADYSFWRTLQQIPLDVEQERNLIDLWTPFEVKDKKPEQSTRYYGYGSESNERTNARIRYTAKWLVDRPTSNDNCRNAWGLFNAMNNSIARVLSHGQVDKRILGDKRAESYLESALVN